ncbi:MAG: GntR family transcriptional regulator [Lachnospiraceae bacterium]|nr:GntR family transcriptional regulator [Lachnospiraceae bacterium]
MLIEIDFDSSEALYIQLYNQVIKAIAANRLRDGDSLPSVRVMADELGVNMHTVNKAYALLREDGYVNLDRRNGAVVAVRVEDHGAHMESMHDNMEMIIAQAVCKNIELEEMQELVREMYEDYRRLSSL